jgi:hypothetical protein
MSEDARLFWVDAFASNPFAGNPAAVCLTTEELPDDVKQAIARELNLSETVFIQHRADSYGSHRRAKCRLLAMRPWPPPISCSSASSRSAML